MCWPEVEKAILNHDQFAIVSILLGLWTVAPMSSLNFSMPASKSSGVAAKVAMVAFRKQLF